MTRRHKYIYNMGRKVIRAMQKKKITEEQERVQEHRPEHRGQVALLNQVVTVELTEKVRCEHRCEKSEH